MSRHLLPTPSLAVSITALVVAMGGKGYAATKLSGSNIKAGTITGKQIKSRSLGAGKLSAKTIAALRGATGAAGAVGPAGPAGPAGPIGPNGIAALKIVKSAPIDLPVGVQKPVSQPCPAGSLVMGGGISTASTSTKVVINASYPDGLTNWRADVSNESLAPTTFTVYALCIIPDTGGAPQIADRG
jgi:hypothetical protein